MYLAEHSEHSNNKNLHLNFFYLRKKNKKLKVISQGKNILKSWILFALVRLLFKIRHQWDQLLRIIVSNHG